MEPPGAWKLPEELGDERFIARRLHAGLLCLPDAVGRHASECGHPEMRLLPNGVYRCQGCGAEALPVRGSRNFWRREERGATA